MKIWLKPARPIYTDNLWCEKGMVTEVVTMSRVLEEKILKCKYPVCWLWGKLYRVGK